MGIRGHESHRKHLTSDCDFRFCPLMNNHSINSCSYILLLESEGI